MVIATTLASWIRGRTKSITRIVSIQALAKLFLVTVLGCWSVGAQAESGGITGYSGNPSTNSGANCTSCHSGGTYGGTPSLSTPTTIAPSATISLTFSLASKGELAGGLDVSVTSGTLVAGTGTYTSSGELTHTMPQVSSSPSWNFSYIAPSSAFGTVVHMYACGNPVNDDSDDTGDGPAQCTTKTMTIDSPPQANTDSYSVNKNSSGNTLNVLSNDFSGNGSNESGDSISITSVGATNHGGIVTNNGSSLSYKPATGYSGTETFTYQVTDSLNATSNFATVTVTVNNHAPVATADSYSVNENSTLTVGGSGVLGNDTDSDGDSLTVSSHTSPSHGTLTLNSNGSFTYTPTNLYIGSDSFTYQASDGTLNSTSTTVSLTVSLVNFPPNGVADSYTTAEEQTLNVTAPGVLANDSDPNSGTLTAVLGTQPAHGTLSLNSNGSFSYVPNALYRGTDSFTYTAKNGLNASSNPVTVTITLTPVNHPPVAVADSYTTPEEATLNVAAGNGVLFNDSDPDSPYGDTLTAVLNTTTTHGTLALNSNGSFSYVPNTLYRGSDSFTYHARDASNATSSVVTVNITVTPVNHPPVAVADSYSVNEDAILTVAANGVLANDTDPDPDTLTAVLASTTTHGTLTLNSNGSFSYLSTQYYRGSDSFTYRANDGTVNSNTVTVSIMVIPVNHPPVATADSYSVNEDATLTVAANAGVLANDSDVDGDTLTASVVSTTTHGTLTLNSNGSFSYLSNQYYRGSDSFTYHANDGTVNSTTVTVNITVVPVNHPPATVADSYTTLQETTLNVAASNGVLTNDTDVDGDALTAALVSTTAHGTLTFNSDGSFSYVPAYGYRGADSFFYNANDGQSTTLTTVNIIVTAVNHAPVATNDGLYSAFANTTLNVAAASGVLANDSDRDNDPLTAVLVVAPAHGTLTLNNDGSFAYTPAANYMGPDQFTYQASDGTLTSSIATVTLSTITGPPVITVPADIKLTATGYLTAVDLSAATATDVHDGTLAVTATPKSPLRPGHHVIIYTAKNSTGSSATATQNVDITPLASVGADQVTGRGRNIDVNFILNGSAVTYPVTLTYNVSGTATSSDANVVNGMVTINSGTRAILQIAIANDAVTTPDRTLIITLVSASNAVFSTNTSSTITIVDRNIAPSVSLSASQQSMPRARVYGTDGLVTINAQAIDPNAGDTITYDWSGTDPLLLAPTDSSSSSFTLCPVISCTGSTTIVPNGNYVVTVKATDSQGASTTRHWTLFVGIVTPTLTTADSDQDGVNDITEGVGDSWDTGLADYLNPYDDAFVIPDQVATGITTHALETQSGLSLHVGATSLLNGGSGALLTAPPADATYTHASGVFDFEIRGLQTGGVASIVLPLQSKLDAGASYREYVVNAGWRNFTSSASDTVFSASASNGVCPGPDSTSWISGLSANAQCVRLTITDGGPNDADGVADGVIANVGGAAATITTTTTTPTTAPAKHGGGALTWQWLLMLSMLTALARSRRRSRLPGN